MSARAASTRPGTPRTSAGAAPQLARRERQEPVEPIAERVELRLRPVVGAAADDRFARVEQQVQHRLVPARPDRAPGAIMSSSEEYDGRSQRMRSSRSARSTRLVVYGLRRARVGVLQRLRQPPVQRRRHRDFEHVARAGPVGAVVGEEVGRQRRLDEFRPALVRFVEERRDARLDQIAAGARARTRDRRRTRTVPSDTRPAARRPRSRSPRSGCRAALRTARSGSVDAYGWRADVLARARRRLPRVMMRADLAVPAVQERRAAHPPSARPVATGCVITYVGRDAVPRKQRVQPRQRIDVLEPLVARARPHPTGCRPRCRFLRADACFRVAPRIPIRATTLTDPDPNRRA